MIKELTSLRAIFIVIIFVHHLDIYSAGGSLGVAFFFVLSGFSLTLGYGKTVLTRDFKYKNYAIRRLIKFYPIHWLCLLLSIPYSIIQQKWQIAEFFVNAALIQTWIPTSDYYFSFNSVSWFLADTVFLALLFPFFCHFLIRLSKKGLIFFLIFFFFIYVTLQVLLYHHGVYAFTYINPISRIPDLIIGIVLAIGYNRFFQEKKELQNVICRNKRLLSLLCLFSIIALVIESIFIEKRQTEIAMFYWPLISVALLSAILLAHNNQPELGGAGG